MIYRAKMTEAYARVEWCKQQFGSNGQWRRIKGYLYFDNSEDYLLFALRWS